MAATCSRRFVLKSVRPGTVLFSPPTPASGSHCPSFPHRAHVAPSHSSCEWHSDRPTAWMLHVLAAGGLVPPIYFYIYALSLQLAASSQVQRGGSVEEYRLLLMWTIWVLTVGSVRTAAAAAAAALPPSS